MKKTFPANINGRVFYIDEDAYNLLNSYLSQLSATFPGDEGTEIVADIEERISEHFDNCIKHGANVIVIDDVNHVIEIMGRPEELSDSPAPAQQPTPPPIHHHLYRDARHKVFGGVIAGLAQYLGWDATIMRILITILALVTQVWPLVIIYLVAWMVIPVARTPRQILEMQGQPVTLGNIGQTVIDNSAPADPSASVPGSSSSPIASLLNTFFTTTGKLIIGIIGLLTGLTSFALLCCLLIALVGIGAYSFGATPDILSGLDVDPEGPVLLQGWCYASIFAAVFIPMAAITWLASVVIFRVKAPGKGMIISAIILELLLIVAAVVLHNLTEGYLLAITIGEFHPTPLLACMAAPATMLCPSVSI